MKVLSLSSVWLAIVVVWVDVNVIVAVNLSSDIIPVAVIYSCSIKSVASAVGAVVNS